MNTEDVIYLAKKAVVDWYTNSFVKCVTPEMVYVVWYCKTLQNNKVLLSTTVPDGRYFEFTYNGNNAEGYLDCYKKEDNVVCRKDDLV